MIPDHPQNRIIELRSLLEKHNKNYYEEDNPIISDAQYDSLFHELKNLEKQHPSLYSGHSPTQRVGGKASGKFPTIAHHSPMLSLDNVFNKQDLMDFITRLANLLRLPNPMEETYFCAEPKLDGLALSLHYEKGLLKKALTRGDGAVGEDVTNNAKAINDIPLSLAIDSNNLALQNIEVRGEVFMTKNTLAKLNRIQQENNQKTYANSRNFAAGTLRQLDPQIVAQRELNFYVYGAIASRPISDSHHRMLKMLALWGLPINEEIQCLQGINSLMDYYENLYKKRNNLAYDIDGIVYKLDNISMQNLAGNTQRAPRWAIAHKFPSEQAISHIESIDIQIGRTGVLTPVARLRPTTVAGVTISNATLHNLDEIQRKDIRQFDEVFIRRAGDVIPEVVKLVNPNRIPTSPSFTMPKICPSCGSKVVRIKKQAHFRCTNSTHCPDQLYQAICHFIARKAMAIDGLGKQRIQQLLQQQLIHNIADLYTLSSEKLAKLPKMKEKSINNILQSITASKTTTFVRFLYAIGMYEVGEVTAQNLAQIIETKMADHPLAIPAESSYSKQCLDNLQNMSMEELVEIDDIGPAVAQSIYDFFQNETNQHLLQQCLANGITWQASIEPKENQTLKGQTIVLTGTLASMGRELAKQKLQARGAKVTTSLSKATTILVAGENAGSKMSQAEKLAIPIWDEEELLKNLSL